MTPIVLSKEIKWLYQYNIDLNNCCRQKFSFSWLVSTIKCGRYSKIPFCCILFFVCFWIPLFYLNSFQLIKKFIKWYPPRKGYNYVACPLCLLIGRRVTIKKCDYKGNEPGCCLHCKH